MFGLDPIALGTILLALGALAVGFTRLAAEWTGRQPAETAGPQPSPFASLDLEPPSHGLIITQPGGRVAYINDPARRWFALNGEEPNLHRMADQARPTDLFLDLCATEGQARLSIGDLAVEATSHRLALATGPGMVIVLREMGALEVDSPETAQETEFALQALAELSHSIAQPLDLEDTVQTILRGTRALVPSDIVEINLWDPKSETLLPIRSGSLRSAEFEIATEGEVYHAGEGYTGWLVQHRRPLLIPDIDQRPDVGPKVGRERFPFNAYLGVPLIHGSELIGTLEVSSLQPNAYDNAHRTLLELIGTQAATAIHDAQLQELHQRRADELAGLSELANAVSSLTDREELFGRLTQGIARLLNVDVLGFLLFDDASQNLIGQTPFAGIPDPFVERYYQIPSPPQSAAATIWHSREYWLSNDVEHDPEVDAIGIRALAQAASIRTTLVVPVVRGGRRLGIIQAANKTSGTPFDEDDIRLLLILAGQSAALIENAKLVGESRQRAERAEGMRRVTALAASAATLDEILTYTLRELANLTRADIACILLLDEDRGELYAREDSLIGISPSEANAFLRISTDDPSFQATITRTQRPTLTNEAREDVRRMGHLRQLIEQRDLESLMAVPLVVGNSGIGEFVLAKTTDDGFNGADLELASTFAGQIAGAVERARLSAQTDVSLRRRVDQLTALIRISRELNVTLDLEPLMRLVHEEALRTTDATCGHTVLFDLDAGGGQPKIALNIGDTTSSLTPLELEVLESGGSRVISDISSSPFEPPHAGVESLLVTPIAYHGQTAGLIHLHSRRPEHFDEASIQITEGLAIQAAIAIDNVQRYQDQTHRAELLRRRAEALSQIFYISNAVRTEQPLEVNLETIAYGLQAASGFNIVVISRLHPESMQLERKAVAGLPHELEMAQAGMRIHWDVVRELFRDEFRRSQSYLIAQEQLPERSAVLLPLEIEATDVEDSRAWRPRDLLLVPLYGMDGSPIGLITLHDPRNNLRPDRETIETIEIFANQAALSIENTMLYAQAETTVGSLTRQLEDLRSANQELSRTVRQLLRQETENSRQLESHRRRAGRIQSLVRVYEVASTQADETAILRTFAAETLRELDLSLILIAEPRDLGLTVSFRVGAIEDDVNIEALMGQNNPLRAAFRQNEALVVPDVAASHEWARSPLLNAVGAEAALAFPLLVDGELVAAALLISDEAARVPFDEDDLELFEGFAQQLAGALEQIRLLRGVEQRLAEGNLLLEFSRQLGSLNLSEMLNDLADGLRRAMPATEASLVALWQPDRGALIPEGASGYVRSGEIFRIRFHPGEALPGKVYVSGEELIWPEVDFARDVNLDTLHLEYYTRATDGRVPASALGVPLKAGDAILGVIVLENYTSPEAFSESDATFVRSLARQAALTIQNARLYQSTEYRSRQVETLANVSATLTSSLDSQQIVQSLLVEFGRVLPYDTATLWLREGEQLSVVAAQGFADDEDRIGLTVRLEDSALYEEMVRNQQPIMVQDTANDSRFPSFPDYPVRSWLGIPLLSRDEMIGLLSLDNHETGGYEASHLEIATTLARQAAVAMENARLFEQTRQSSEELERRVADRTQELELEHERSEALLRITAELASSLDLDRVLARALSLVNDVVGSDRGVILLVAPDSDQLILRAQLGGSEELPPGGRPSPFTRGDGLAGWIIEERSSVVIPDLTHDERWVPHHDKLEEHKSALGVPLMVSEDALGALLFFSHRRNAFAEHQLRLVVAAANQVAAAINNAELYRLIRDQAERLGSMLRAQQVEASKSRAILESIADGVVVTDEEHRIVLFNAPAGRILNLKEAETMGRSATEFLGVYGAAGRRWAEAVQSWSRSPTEAGSPDSVLAERLTLDDNRVVSVHLAPVVLGEEFLGTVSIFRDITREVEVDRLKSEFVATVSHELRTPMTSIKGYVEVLLMGAGGPLSDEQRRFLEIVKGNTDRLGILVNDLLDISRIEAGKVDLSFQPIDVEELLEEARQFIHRRTLEESKPMETEIDAPAGLPMVRGDPERLRQIVFNLVDNSFNYTHAGGRILLRARAVGNEVEIEVIDNGVGIAPPDHERVFERFFRGEQALDMAVSGTGLGLSIVEQLVEMHGGRIWVSSEGTAGKGATFTFTLPVSEASPEFLSTQDEL